MSFGVTVIPFGVSDTVNRAIILATTASAELVP